MIPNNNLSVLPWYTSIEQQNARKWWVYGRVYPLFTPAGFLPPFQVLRDAIQEEEFTPVGQRLREDYFRKGEFFYIENGEINVNGRSAGSFEYFTLDNSIRKIYFQHLPPGEPAPQGGTTANIAFVDSNGNVIWSNNLVGHNGVYNGGMNVPNGAAGLYVQYENSDLLVSAEVFEAESELVPARITLFEIYTKSGQLVGDYTEEFLDAIVVESLGDYDCIIYPGVLPFATSFENGQYYAVMEDEQNRWYSEVFTVVNDIEPYLKITWYDEQDFVMDAGTIVYRFGGGRQFANVLYLKADIAKPEYVFEEEGETRDGYFFPTKQISEKKYRFSFFASEYLLDVMRFIRMADYAYIEKNGQRYSLDTFLITPEWEDNGDIASVAAEFETATVAKKIGQGYIKAQRGDFNDDFNNDYNNQK